MLVISIKTFVIVVLLHSGCDAFSLRCGRIRHRAPALVAFPKSKVTACWSAVNPDNPSPNANEEESAISVSTNNEDTTAGTASPRSPPGIASRLDVDALLAKPIPTLPNGDSMDRKILTLAIPAVLNFLIIPLVGAVDTYWVGRMKNALALAGQGAANQVFNSAFWIISFLPSVMTPLVAKAYGAGDEEGVRQRVGEAFLLCILIGSLGMAGLTLFPYKALSLVLRPDSPALEFAAPYLSVRGLTILPALLSTIGFAVFRGTMDVITPLKIAAFSNLVNIILDPVMIFSLAWGVTGAAAATCVAELTSFILYIRALVRRRMLDLKSVFRLPSKDALVPLVLGGFSVQLRSIALNTAMLSVTRTAQLLDTTGTMAAAHTISIQMFQLGSVSSLALSTIAAIITPTIIAKAVKENHPDGLLPARQAANRLLAWGCIVGTVLAALQLVSLPLLGLFTPLADVQQAARLPSIIGAVLQLLNCIVWTGEGVMQGTESFLTLAIGTILGTACMMGSLRFLGLSKSLVGVWLGFGFLGVVRLIAVLRFHFFSGPLARRNLKEIA